MEATSIGRRRRPRNASEDRGLTDTEDSESEDEQQEEVGSDEEGLDYLQLFAAAISALRTPRNKSPLQISDLTNRTFQFLSTGDEEKDDEGAEEEEEDGAQKVKRRRLVQPLEAAYAHFEQQDAHLQQAAAFGKMLVRPNLSLLLLHSWLNGTTRAPHATRTPALFVCVANAVGEEQAVGRTAGGVPEFFDSQRIPGQGMLAHTQVHACSSVADR
jgi:hypothetical protein